MNFISNRFKKKFNYLFLISFLLSFLFSLFAIARHYLFQSNAYDLGLFDQWLWLSSKGLPPFSSMTGLHMFADHGAWFLYIASLVYKFSPSINLLLISQAFALCFTTVPIWFIAKNASLDDSKSFFVCILYLLQPVVFNVNIFDFHPEVWAMPFIALTYLAERKNKIIIWSILLFIILGTRDGLVLFVIGLGLEQAFKRRLIWASIALFIGSSWLYLLNNIIYPPLHNRSTAIMAIGRYSKLGGDFKEIIQNLYSNPMLIIEQIDFYDSFFYLLILILPFVFLWKKKSLIVLTSFIPLFLSNILSEAYAQRTLIHHYSLPFSIIGTVAVIDGFAFNSKNKSYLNIKNNFIWLFLIWGMLSKPWFFTGPYLRRISYTIPFEKVTKLIESNHKVLTTSYFVPHLSQRQYIRFPESLDELNSINEYDILLLNKDDPGWGSSKKIQQEFVKKAKLTNWKCELLNKKIDFCQKIN